MKYDPYVIGSCVYDIVIEPFLFPIKRLTTEFLQKHFRKPNDTKVLEVACGTGTQSRFLARKGFRVTALDKSSSMIRRTYPKHRTHAGSLASIRADASLMPFPSSVFDAVVFQMALHEMKDDIRRLSVLETMRVAKDEAWFIFADFVPVQDFSVLTHVMTLVERAAGAEHYRNGQQFIKEGGLMHFLSSMGLRADPVHLFFHGHVCLAAGRKTPSSDP